MDRPKRFRKKPANLLPPPDKLDLSDLEDDESDGDFSSASSDEYNPNISKNKSISESSEEDENDAVSSESGSDDEKNSESPLKKPQRAHQSSSKCLRNDRKNHIATLRKEVINKFKNSSQKSTTSKKLHDILKKAQFGNKKSIFDGSESEDENKAPNFDCSGGLQLSDSGSDSESEDQKVKKGKSDLTIQNSQSNDSSDNEQDANGLKVVHDNLQKMKEIAKKLAETANKKVAKVTSKENVNISDILAMGETVAKDARAKSSKSKSQKKRAQSDESDSDDNWEDVEEDESSAYKGPKEDIEILLNDFGQNERGKQAKPVDVEAQLKRKFNRIRKEHQEHLHKSQLLSWIGHGNFVNSRLNDIDLMKSVLKLLPNNKGQCYPKDKTDISYFKQITKYYKQEMELRNSEMYCTRLKNRPPLMLSLALQMKFKAAICRRDYVLIFATLLRAIGIQCRVVNSLVCDPKVCPKSELLSLSKKPTEEGKKKPSASRKSSSKSSNKKKKKIKIPQLDGGDDKIPRRKTRSAKGNQVLPKQLKSSHTKTFPPKVKVSVESPNRMEKPKASAKLKNGNEKLSENAKKNRSVEMTKKATLNILSPRKTRSMSRDQSPKPSTSSQLSKVSSINAKKEPEKKTAANKDTLKIVLSRTTRSRSRSNETKTPKETKKPNLQKLASKRKAADDSSETLEPKIAKVAEKSPIKSSNSRKREANTKNNEVEIKKPRVAKISESSDDGSLKYFKLDKSTKLSPVNSSKASKIDRRILSSDDDEKEVKMSSSPKKSKGIDIWVEVYSEKEEKWIAIDVFHGKVDCVQEISKKCTQPAVYVFAWNNDNTIKDISARYCKDFNTRIRKMRVDREYLNSVLNLFAGTRTSRDFKEDDELNKIQLKEEMPKSIAEFKNHPLYALKRHLLKFQAIYPPEPPILGYIREEAIYPRDCVFTMHSRETWLKEARVVKLYEKPYKMVTTIKWDKAKNKLLRDVPLELFGIWQTKDYEPPVAENGVVPRNGYGNVELFKACMLPIGTIHLQLPGLNRVCKKLNIDCAQAVVGFDSNGGWPFPVYDGFVVCKEFEEKVIDAWNRDRDEMEKKEREKFEKRVYGNWKQLIKGLIIRERLKQKYNFEQK